MIMISHVVKTMEPSAKALKRELSKLGLEAWICEEDIGPGTPYRQAITKAASSCATIVILCDQNWAESGECEFETNIAISRYTHGRKCMVLPVAFAGLNWEATNVIALAANMNFTVIEAPDLANQAHLQKVVRDIAQLAGKKLASPSPKIASPSKPSMDGKIFKMYNRWSGEDKWISFTSDGKQLRAVYNEGDAMPVKMFATGSPNTYLMKNVWPGEDKWISFADDGKWLRASYSKQSDAMPVQLHPTDRPNIYYLKNVWSGQNKWISFTWDGRWLRAVYDNKEADAMPVEFLPYNL